MLDAAATADTKVSLLPRDRTVGIDLRFLAFESANLRASTKYGN